MKNWKNNEFNKNGSLLCISKRQFKNKCYNIGREETKTKNIDELKNKWLYWFYGLLTN